MTTTWVFQGNPKHYDMDAYLSVYSSLVYWSTNQYVHEIAVGDRAYLWRSGPDGGAIAIGTVVELPTPGTQVKHADALGEDFWLTKPRPVGLHTGIELVDIRLHEAEGMVTRAAAKGDSILSHSNLITAPRTTVFRLSPEQAAALDHLWGAAGPTSPGYATGHWEGNPVLRRHYVRERSSRLRADKLEAFCAEHGQALCELCGEKESDRYPTDFAQRRFEIHHRRPLSTLESPAKTLLSDLAILCANCHRAVHASVSVEENFEALRVHFSGGNA